MNKLIIKGNLTKDIDVKTTSNGALVGEFTVANNERVGENEVTTFIKCVMFGERVEKICPYLLKGTKVLVDGRLEVKTVVNDQLYNTYVSLYVNELDILKFVDGEEETKQTAKQPTRKMYQKRK